jgi:type II secretory pathway component PulC
MKRSLWILTSCSLALCVGAILFAIFTRIQIPNKNSLKPIFEKELKVKSLKPQEISTFYENDLFDTYVPKINLDPKSNEPINISAPQAPQIFTATKLSPQEPNFLEPLPFTLAGTIVLQEESESRAVLIDNRSKKEASYKIGDDVEDGQIIEINFKSITIIRSNGQQETVYLPGSDKILKVLNNVDAIISRHVKDNNYIIDPKAFINKINSLGELIDNFNITTAYQNGISIGCKIGTLPEESLAKNIGLQTGDVIKKIINKSIASLEERVNIYNEIINFKEGDVINIIIKRGYQELNLIYNLKSLDEPWLEPIDKENKEAITKAVKEDLERRYKFAPTIAEIKAKERSNIIRQLHVKNK